MIVENNNLVLSIVMATGDPFQPNILGPARLIICIPINCYHFILPLRVYFQYNVLGAGTVMVWGMRGERIGSRPSFEGVDARTVKGGGYTLVAYNFYFATEEIVKRVLYKILRYNSIIVTVPGVWWSPYDGGRGRRPSFGRGRCEEFAGFTCVIL